MVRSLWIAAVVGGLACTGLAWAQSFSSPGAAAPRDRYMTVREEGRPPQRCKLLKTWRQANGSTAFQVQALDTGELMTVVGSGPALAGQKSGAMATRIFRWGRDNKLPADTPVPPPNATVMGTPLGQPAPQTSLPRPIRPPAPAAVLSQPSIPPRIVTKPQLAPVPVVVRKPDPPPAAKVSAPVFPQPFTPIPSAQANKPSTTVISPLTSGVVKSTPVAPKPVSALPVATAIPPIVQTQPRKAGVETPPLPLANAPAQPRLVPSANGTVCQTPCDCCCPSTCVSCTPPLRQSWLGRIFKPNPSPTVVAAQTVSKPTAPPPPAKPVVKVATEPAQPSDWRKSWGKVEPWKSAQHATTEQTNDAPVKRAARAPLPIDPPHAPDPLKDPDWYRNVALKEKLPNSKVREAVVSSVPSPTKKKSSPVKSKPAPSPLASAPPMQSARPVEVVVTPRPETMAIPPARPLAVSTAPPPNRPPMPVPPASGPQRGRGIELSAKEGNAFWTPPEPPKPSEQQQPPKYNAFQRDANSPPPNGGAPAMAGAPPGAMPMMPPRTPMPPMMAPRPPAMMPPMMVNSGVPSGMGNAFTIAGTRRPIPADFGPTPQEPNGFGDAVPYVAGPASPAMPPRSPMLPPSPGRLGTLQLPMPPRMPMPNQAAMTPRPVRYINPLMAVPPTQIAAGAPTAPTGSAAVPQMLATLKDSLYPSQREWAVEQLSASKGRGQPEIVRSLTKYAKEDPAATVRAACVHALVHMKANTTEVVAVVQELKKDSDPRVRQEVDEALTAMGVTDAVHRDSAVRPASHK